MVDDREQMPDAEAGVEAQIEWLESRGYHFNILTGQRFGRAPVQASIRAQGRSCFQIGFGNGQTVAQALASAWADSQREIKPRPKPQRQPQTQLRLEDLDL